MRRAVSDFRDVTNEVVDYTIASAQLSRQPLLAWAQASGAAAFAAVGRGDGVGVRGGLPELVGVWRRARARHARPWPSFA